VCSGRLLEAIFTKNYRPVSVLPVVSKIFERIMDKQSGQYMEQYLSIIYVGTGIYMVLI
jgi:hypothetical protein